MSGAPAWLLIGGFLLCGLVTSSVLYHLAFKRQAPQDGGIVVLLIPLWPLVVAVVLVLAVMTGAYWLLTLGNIPDRREEPQIDLNDPETARLLDGFHRDNVIIASRGKR